MNMMPRPVDSRAKEAVIKVRDLCVDLPTESGMARAVDHLSFDIKPGTVLGLVGESGSGKSISCTALVKLLPYGARTSGQVEFGGRNLLELSNQELQSVRGRQIGYVFQDPMSSLNPSMTIGAQIAETVRHHTGCSRRSARDRAVELLSMVGIPAASRRADNYPHEFSGGMRQRALIAMAISCEPSLLIADEPTTALDVTIQAQILDLLRDMKEKLGLAIIFVTHDLGVVADICDEVLVLYAGEAVEAGRSIENIFDNPLHPYTRSLLGALKRDPRQPLITIPGKPPTLNAWPDGCRFRPRCAKAFDACHSHPGLYEAMDRQVRCQLYAGSQT